MRITQLLVASLLLGGYFLNNPYSVTTYSPMSHRLLYLFSHAHLLHLLLNGWGICSLLRSLSRKVSPYAILLAAVASGLFSTYLTATAIPTVGASGVLYYLLGYDLLLRWGECYFRIDHRQMEYYTLYLLSTFCITAPLVVVNTWLHIVNFTVGLLSALVYICRTNSR